MEDGAAGGGVKAAGSVWWWRWSTSSQDVPVYCIHTSGRLGLQPEGDEGDISR